MKGKTGLMKREWQLLSLIPIKRHFDMNGKSASIIAKQKRGATVAGPVEPSMEIPFNMNHFVCT